MQMRSQMVLTAEDEQVLWWVLHRHATTVAPADGAEAIDSGSEAGGAGVDGSGSGSCVGEPSLNYDDFVQASMDCAV